MHACARNSSCVLCWWFLVSRPLIDYVTRRKVVWLVAMCVVLPKIVCMALTITMITLYTVWLLHCSTCNCVWAFWHVLNHLISLTTDWYLAYYIQDMSITCFHTCMCCVIWLLKFTSVWMPLTTIGASRVTMHACLWVINHTQPVCTYFNNWWLCMDSDQHALKFWLSDSITAHH